MKREDMLKKAQDIVQAGRDGTGPLPKAVRIACAHYSGVRAQMTTALQPKSGPYTGVVEVVGQGSLEACDESNAGVLVFCSATRPGGGWLSGATAQEESISRASTWALSCAHPVFHSDHGNDGYFYKNAALSVAGAVFERNGVPLQEPTSVHFAGMCAPNARAMEEHHQDVSSFKARTKIVETLTFRMQLALQAFAHAGCKTVVLGAVGCGVFRIAFEDCAQAWTQALQRDGAMFERVVFALGPNPSPDMQKAFSGLEKAFVGRSSGMSLG